MTAHEPVEQEDCLDLGAQTDLWRAQARLAQTKADVLVVVRVLVVLLVGLVASGIGFLSSAYIRFVF